MSKSEEAEKFVVIPDMYKGSVTVVCSKSDKCIQGGGRITSRNSSEPFLVCNGDRQIDRRNQTKNFLDCDVCI